MAGAALLSLSLMGRGKDHSVFVYSQAARRMGSALGLFGVDTMPKTSPVDKASDDNHSASCYAAWGGFNWNV